MNLLFDDTGIIECGCWFHARDKFDRARASAPVRAEEGIAWIATFFEIEDQADEASEEARQRQQRRRRETRPLLGKFQRWMDETEAVFAPDEDISKAIRYCRNHWAALTRFLDDGRIPLTNNLAEREPGVIGRGRKNYLFAGSDAGARRLALVYTVVRTCERLGIDPFEYLSSVLPRISDLPVNRGAGHLESLTSTGWLERRADP